MAYLGLNNNIEVTPGKRTPATASYEVPFLEANIESTGDRVEISGEMVYPFSAQKCFDAMKDYRKFLLSHLKDNEKLATKQLGKQFYAQPMWIKEGNDKKKGTVGCMVQYAYYKAGVVYWMVDKVTTLDDGGEKDPDGNKIFRFAMETQHNRCTPTMPMTGHGTYMIFTTYEKDPNQCHLKWIRKWNKPYFAGCVSVNEGFKRDYEGFMQRDLFTLWMLYHVNYSEKLPKTTSKVLVVGAGPSGLHMTYELIQRGLSENNITILEKEETHYGGKTLSIEDETNVQISNPVYNDPPPRAAMIPQIQAILKKYYTCQTIREAVQLWLQGELNQEQLASLRRKNTPNALQYQEPDEYFAGGEAIFHELGTCYLSPGYYAIRTLLKRIQQQVEAKAAEEKNEQGEWTKMAQADITREVGPDTYAIESNEWEGAKTLEQWIVHAGKDHTYLDEIFSCSPATQYVAVDASVMAAKLNYCKLHNALLGNYCYTLPPRPLDQRFKTLVQPFSDFLTENNLETLAPLFTYAMTAQGYGIIQHTPTFLAMQWLTPDLLDGYFEWYFYFAIYKDSVGDQIRPIPKELQKFNNFRKGMLVSGWGGVWDRIVALYDLKSRIKFGTTIEKITRKNGKVNVNYKHKNNDFCETYDYLIVGAPLSDPASSSPTAQILPLDLDAEEKALFLSKDLRASKFRTTLFKPEKNGDYESDHLRIFIDAILSDAENEHQVGIGEVFGVRDSYKAIQPRLSTQGGDIYDPSKGAPREKMLYQYVSPEKVDAEVEGEQGVKYSDEEYLKRKVRNFFKDHPDYFDKIPGDKEKRIMDMIKQDKAWTYYTHYEQQGLLNGNLWRILDLQGKKNTLFVHASTNFESVLDIVNYNYMILDGLAGRLDNFIHPETDTRPKPWERPQPLLFNRFALHNVIRYVLNLVLFVFWTVWYVISYPFAEGVYLKFQRYQLQKAFQTPELGSPWEYNMTKFINVSPTVRGYMDYIEGKPNGIPDPIPADFDPNRWDGELGPGDTVFKILQAPKNKFLEKYPAIPDYTEIYGSMFWNLADMRTGIAFWLSTFEDSFRPILTPTIQSIIQSFSYFCPNYYSWIFSWLFASQFRLLIGFSYRFEDEQGGGLRIPDCYMLRTAIKDHGTEIGQRICLTVCKIFTEEVMKEKKMQIDFQPDFIEGSGYGCKVRMTNPIDHAYSNHSLYKFRTNEEKEKFKQIDMSW